MKKLGIFLMLALLLTGCAEAPVMETLGDIPAAGEPGQAMQLVFSIPPDSAAPVLNTQTGGKLYECGEFVLSADKLPAGDLDRTLRAVTGYEKEHLSPICTEQAGLKRYDWVWTAAGGQGLRLGRGCLLDDGETHYVLTALADAEKSGELQEVWQEVFRSCRLMDAAADLNAGS